MESFWSQYSSAEGDILLHREGAMILYMNIKMSEIFAQATKYIWISPLKFNIMLEHKWLMIMNFIYNTLQNL